MDWQKLIDSASSGLFGGLVDSLTLPFKRLLYGEDWFNAQTGKALSGSQREMNDYNSLEAEKARQFNSMEAEMARQFNASEAQKNRQFQLDFYNNYQSPQAMVQQAQAAGINPAVMFGGVTTPSSVAGSSASGAAAAGSPASSSGASIGGASIGSLLDMAMQMKKLDIESDVAKSEIKKNEAQSGLSNAQTAEQLIKNGYTEAIQALTVEDKRAEIEQKISSAQVNRSTVEVNGVRIPLLQEQMTQAQAEIQYLQARVITENLDAEKARMSLEYMREVTEAEIALTNAKTTEAMSAAALHYSEVSLNALSHMREDQLITDGFYRKQTQYLQGQIDDIKARRNTEYWQAKQYERDYHWAPVRNIFGILRDTGLALGGIATAASKFTPAGAVASSVGGFTSSSTNMF